MPNEIIENWIEQNVYLDETTKERREILFDDKREKFFFFADPLDFDKDDQMVARYWLDQIEGWNPDWLPYFKENYKN